jgi:hypothetical protein
MAKHTKAYVKGFESGVAEREESGVSPSITLSTDSAISAGAHRFDGFTSAADRASYYRGYAAGLNADRNTSERVDDHSGCGEFEKVTQ